MKIKILLPLALVCAVISQSVNAQTWFKAGSLPNSYEMGGDPTVNHGSPGGGFIKSIVSPINGFGTWMTQMPPGEYLGKGIRLTAYVKTVNVEKNVGLWMRVDGDQQTLSFDNMGSRSLTGTTDWREYEIILDVPENSNQIFFGILLSGTGEAYVDGLKLEPAPRTWAIQNSGISERIFSIKATDENTVWAGAEKGVYLKTTDGGMNWTSGTVPGAESLVLLSIAVIDANTAYFAGTSFSGYDARIYKTTDGGTNWTMQYQNTDPGAFFNSIAFWDENHGIAVSDPVNGSFLIVTTSDGGTNWNKVPAANIPPPLPNEYGFGDGGGTIMSVAGSNHVWFGTGHVDNSNDPVRVFKSDDQGQTWTAINTTLTNEGLYHGVATMAFKDTLIGFVTSFGIPYSENVVNMVKTIDGGTTWTEVSSFLPIGPSTLVFVPNSNNEMLFVTSYQGAAHSSDGGDTWIRRSTQSYSGMSFASPTAGWATGGYATPGRIVKYVPEEISATEDQLQQKGLQLSQNYPNPFSPSTTIEYFCPKPGHVTLKIFNPSGQVLETLVDGYRSAGSHQVVWQPKELPSGLYFYRIEAGEFSLTKKLILNR